MRLSTQVKPISYVKSHAAEVLRDLEVQQDPLIITQNGEAKAVLQDIRSYEKTQETLALLKMLAMGSQQVREGKFQPLDEAVRGIEDRIRSRR